MVRGIKGSILLAGVVFSSGASGRPLVRGAGDCDGDGVGGAPRFLPRAAGVCGKAPDRTLGVALMACRVAMAQGSRWDGGAGRSEAPALEAPATKQGQTVPFQIPIDSFLLQETDKDVSCCWDWEFLEMKTEDVEWI